MDNVNGTRDKKPSRPKRKKGRPRKRGIKECCAAYIRDYAPEDKDAYIISFMYYAFHAGWNKARLRYNKRNPKVKKDVENEPHVEHSC